MTDFFQPLKFSYHCSDTRTKAANGGGDRLGGALDGGWCAPGSGPGDGIVRVLKESGEAGLLHDFFSMDVEIPVLTFLQRDTLRIFNHLVPPQDGLFVRSYLVAHEVISSLGGKKGDTSRNGWCGYTSRLCELQTVISPARCTIPPPLNKTVVFIAEGLSLRWCGHGAE